LTHNTKVHPDQSNILGTVTCKLMDGWTKQNLLSKCN